MIRTRAIFAFGILCCFFPLRSHAFFWDQHNINRVFGDSDQIFAGITLEEGQEKCFEEFKAFVDNIKTQRNWGQLGNLKKLIKM